MDNAKIYKSEAIWICDLCCGDEVMIQNVGDTPIKALENAMKELYK